MQRPINLGCIFHTCQFACAFLTEKKKKKKALYFNEHQCCFLSLSHSLSKQFPSRFLVTFLVMLPLRACGFFMRGRECDCCIFWVFSHIFLSSILEKRMPKTVNINYIYIYKTVFNLNMYIACPKFQAKNMLMYIISLLTRP